MYKENCKNNIGIRTIRHPWLEMLARNELLQLRIGRVDFVREVMRGDKITCVKLVSGSHKCRVRAENVQGENADKILNIDVNCETQSQTLQDDVSGGGVGDKKRANSSHFSPLTSPRFAFTLSEVLLTLGIIGVIAAITLPTLINNAKHKELEAAFKKSYSNFFNAYNKAMINSPQTNYSGTVNVNTELAEAIYSEYATNTPVGSTRSYYYAIKIRTYALKKGRWPECSGLFNNAGKITTDGSVIGIVYNCGTSWVTLDTNGLNKGPNAYGHDVFLFTISNSGVVKPAEIEAEAIVDEEGHFSYNNTPENVEKCSLTATSAVNGVTCAKYALQDKCPNDPSKGYWECLP